MIRVPILVLSLVAALLSAFAEQGLQTAKILFIRTHPQGRINHWEGRVPIFDGQPVYDITLLWNHKKYIVRYESLTGYYPKAWEAGNEIHVKRERGKFLLYRGDEAVPAREVSSYDCVSGSAPPTPAPATPEVPCE
ncbi:MAG: hypothetical protein C5B55_10710 [Blastocatellia bacterium]|nr:MAG: hypothetical protein C5B55_10710 [Blastocatellia bacterium]